MFFLFSNISHGNCKGTFQTRGIAGLPNPNGIDLRIMQADWLTFLLTGL